MKLIEAHPVSKNEINNSIMLTSVSSSHVYFLVLPRPGKTIVLLEPSSQLKFDNLQKLVQLDVPRFS